jgi:hypothetical protein
MREKEIFMQMTEEERIEKVAIVENYLQKLFPECVVETERLFKSKAYFFSIAEVDDNKKKHLKHCVKVTDEFLAATKKEEIPKELDKRKVKSLLDMAGNNEVLIKS